MEIGGLLHSLLMSVVDPSRVANEVTRLSQMGVPEPETGLWQLGCCIHSLLTSAATIGRLAEGGGSAA